MIRVFPYGVAILEGAAAVVYLWKGDRLLAVVWGCYAVSAALLGYRA